LLIPSPIIIRKSIKPYIPYGLCSLQAVSVKHSAEVDVLQVNDNGTYLENSREVVDFMLDRVHLEDYDVVGISTAINGFHHVLNIAQSIKERMPKTRVWLGGPHASVLGETILKASRDIDAIFIGEGEAIFSEILEHQIKKSYDNHAIENIHGIMTRKNEYFPRKPIDNLDCLPMINLSNRYLDDLNNNHNFGTKKEAPLEVTRGCPGFCGFCSTRLYWGQKVRRKSFNRIISEMQQISKLTNRRDFSLIGDNFGFPRQNLEDFCKKMIAANPGFNWGCSLRLNDLEPEDLSMLWAAGCRGFFTGIESGSEKTQKHIGKNIRLDHAQTIIDKAIDIGFDVETSFIIGFPWETLDDINLTYKMHCHMLKAGVTRSDIHVLIPLNGTPLSNKYKVKFETNSYVPHDWMDFIPLDDTTLSLFSQFPEMFLQFGYFENSKLNRLDLLATNDAARNIKSLYLD